MIRFERVLLSLVLVELFTGGGGRLLVIGGLTVRMLLFGVCMLYMLVRFTVKPVVNFPHELMILIFIFFAVISFASLIGVARDADLGAIAEDIKPLMYFPMLAFFFSTIRLEKDVVLIVRLLAACAVFQAVLYLTMLSLNYLGIVPLADVYLPLNDTGEFFFREVDGSLLGFFYKGFMYMCVGLIFLVWDKHVRSIVGALIVLSAIILTFTRGFLLSLATIMVLGVIIHARQKVPVVLGAAAVTLIGIVAVLVLPLPEVFQRSESDAVRLADIAVFLNQVDAIDLILGNGFGSFIGDRDKIEITYLQVLYKQGITGLVFWFFLLIVNVRAYLRIKPNKRKDVLPFLLSALFVYIQTATNPFLNNPIGMSIVLVSTAVFYSLLQSRPEAPPAESARMTPRKQSQEEIAT
jgi:hypothetical protein